MNVYSKLQKCRCELQKKKLTKSGKNKFAGFSYFELQDFLPTVNDLFLENGLSSNFSLKENVATLEIIDFEAKENEPNVTTFTTKVEDLELKGCNKVQALGGAMTYLKRYLYLNALEIVESDLLDSVTGQEVKETKVDYMQRLKDCKTIDELAKEFRANLSKVTNKDEFTALKDEMKAKLEAQC